MQILVQGDVNSELALPLEEEHYHFIRPATITNNESRMTNGDTILSAYICLGIRMSHLIAQLRQRSVIQAKTSKSTCLPTERSRDQQPHRDNFTFSIVAYFALAYFFATPPSVVPHPREPNLVVISERSQDSKSFSWCGAALDVRRHERKREEGERETLSEKSIERDQKIIEREESMSGRKSIEPLSERSNPERQLTPWISQADNSEAGRETNLDALIRKHQENRVSPRDAQVSQSSPIIAQTLQPTFQPNSFPSGLLTKLLNPPYPSGHWRTSIAKSRQASRSRQKPRG